MSLKKMFLESLQLTNFRNYDRENFLFDPGINLLVGKNAQGKTNVVEAISILTTGRSFRAVDQKDAIRHGFQSAKITARVRGAHGSDEIAASIGAEGKRFLKNGKKTAAASIRGFASVLFAPEEIVLLRDSPSARRRYIDTFISQVDSRHRDCVRKYEKILSHRNRLLQDRAFETKSGQDDLELWDEQLVNAGTRVILGRAKWCSMINNFLPDEYSTISPSDRFAEFRYRPNCAGDLATKEDVIADFTVKLSGRREDERLRGITLAGPHRDDFEARVGEIPLQNYGSQGEHRTFVLALKMAEAAILKRETGEDPIFLFDDVASELDEDRSRFLFDHVSTTKGQVFITTTDEASVRISAQSGIKKFVIDSGQIVNKSGETTTPSAADPPAEFLL